MDYILLDLTNLVGSLSKGMHNVNRYVCLFLISNFQSFMFVLFLYKFICVDVLCTFTKSNLVKTNLVHKLHLVRKTLKLSAYKNLLFADDYTKCKNHCNKTYWYSFNGGAYKIMSPSIDIYFYWHVSSYVITCHYL